MQIYLWIPLQSSDHFHQEKQRTKLHTNIPLLKANPQFSNEDEILLKEPVKLRDKTVTVKIIEPSDH